MKPWPLTFLLAYCAAAQEPAALTGGATTVFNAGKEAFSLPLANAKRETKREFVVGNSFFNENWIIAPASPEGRDGLGPLFHARSCSACHVKDGRGAPPAQPEDVPTGLLFRLSVPGGAEHEAPKPDPTYGEQLATKGIPGVAPEAEISVAWLETPGAFADGEKFSLRKPKITFSKWHYGPPSKDILVSPRLAPASFGGGLLEAIPEAEILSRADPDDRNGDGISGRPNMVWDAVAQKKKLGRFGWKASQPSLRQQAAEAFLSDLGLTSPVRPDGEFTAAQAAVLGKFPNGGKPEISAQILDRVEVYLQALAPPARRDVDSAQVKRGETLFQSLRCAECHVLEWKTGGDHPLAELRDQIVRPGTDLLLHDMGEDLADGRPEFAASGAEWRTAPLWGFGLNAEVNGNAYFLHDGRARNATEAILWHGGEAAVSRDGFKALPKADRDALLAFLASF